MIKQNTLHTRERFCTSKLYFYIILLFIYFILVASFSIIFVIRFYFISLTPQIYYYTIIVFICYTEAYSIQPRKSNEFFREQKLRDPPTSPPIQPEQVCGPKGSALRQRGSWTQPIRKHCLTYKTLETSTAQASCLHTEKTLFLYIRVR